MKNILLLRRFRNWDNQWAAKNPLISEHYRVDAHSFRGGMSEPVQSYAQSGSGRFVLGWTYLCFPKREQFVIRPLICKSSLTQPGFRTWFEIDHFQLNAAITLPVVEGR